MLVTSDQQRNQFSAR